MTVYLAFPKRPGRTMSMSLVSTIKATVDSTMLTEVYYAETPKVEDYVDENGVRTTVEYIINDEGKKVKVCSI